MIQRRTKNVHIITIALMILLTFFLMTGTSSASEQVSARYLQAYGNSIVVELGVSSPPPALLIVIQKLPKGTEVTGSSPELLKYKPRKGVAKWLLRDITPGKMRISLNLATSLEKGAVKGEVRWRDQEGRKVRSKIKNQ